MPTLTIQWRRLGPYHLARLRATSAYFETQGWNVSTLESAKEEATYQWSTVEAPIRVEHHQVFSDRSYEDVGPRELFRATHRSLDEISPDVVAISSGYSTPDERACLSWCLKNNQPAIVMTDSKVDDAPRNPLREWGKRRMMRLYDSGLTAGTRSHQYLEKLGLNEDHIFRPYDVVDNRLFRRGGESARANQHSRQHLPGLTSNHLYFLASNRFLESKNLFALLKAYSNYRVHADNAWNLVLLGDGPLRSSLEEQAGTGVVFAGFQQIEQLPAYYGLASAFIHPTLKDTWGLVVNEAMAAGLPVIVSESAGCAPDLVTHGWNGFHFDPRNTEELTEHMLTMASYSETQRKEMGARSQERIAGYSPDAFAKGMWEAVQAAVSHARDRRHNLLGRLILAGVQAASRSHTSFHTVRD